MTLKVPVDLLRDPVTHEALRLEGRTRLVTERSARSYPVVDGVPVLVDEAASVFSADQIAASARRAPVKSPVRRLARRLMLSSALGIGTEERYARFERLVSDAAAGARARVLVVGGGQLGRGMERLAHSPSVELI